MHETGAERRSQPRGAMLDRLGKHKRGTGCLYVKRLPDIDITVLEQLIDHTSAGCRQPTVLHELSGHRLAIDQTADWQHRTDLQRVRILHRHELPGIAQYLSESIAGRDTHLHQRLHMLLVPLGRRVMQPILRTARREFIGDAIGPEVGVECGPGHREDAWLGRVALPCSALACAHVVAGSLQVRDVAAESQSVPSPVRDAFCVPPCRADGSRRSDEGRSPLLTECVGSFFRSGRRGHGGSMVRLGSRALIALLLVSACARRPVSTISADPDNVVALRWNARVSTPPEMQALVQAGGRAWITSVDAGRRTRVDIELNNLVSGGQYPWVLRYGRCGAAGGEVARAEGKNELSVGRDGRAKASTEFDRDFPASGDYMIEVLATNSSATQVIACGNFAPPSMQAPS